MSRQPAIFMLVVSILPLSRAFTAETNELNRERIPLAFYNVRTDWKYNERGLIIGADFGSADLLPAEGRRVIATDLKYLEHLPNLHFIRFHEEDMVDDSWLLPVGKLKRLEKLGLSLTQVKSKGINDLRPLKELRDLDVSNTAIDDDAVDAIASLEKLEVLNIRETQISDLGIEVLSRLKSLRSLQIGSSQNGGLITNRSVAALSSLKDLRLLDVYSTAIDKDGIKILRETLPTHTVIKSQHEK